MRMTAAFFAGSGIGVVVVECGEDTEFAALEIEIVWGGVAENEAFPQKIAAHAALNGQFENVAAVTGNGFAVFLLRSEELHSCGDAPGAEPLDPVHAVGVVLENKRFQTSVV